MDSRASLDMASLDLLKMGWVEKSYSVTGKLASDGTLAVFC